jgi:hypothetical protein
LISWISLQWINVTDHCKLVPESVPFSGSVPVPLNMMVSPMSYFALFAGASMIAVGGLLPTVICTVS